MYGIIPTFQPEASFGKVYAAYGGVFIALSILWGWLIDGLRPDMYDIIGGLVCLVGVYIIMYAPVSYTHLHLLLQRNRLQQGYL